MYVTNASEESNKEFDLTRTRDLFHVTLLTEKRRESHHVQSYDDPGNKKSKCCRLLAFDRQNFSKSVHCP